MNSTFSIEGQGNASDYGPMASFGRAHSRGQRRKLWAKITGQSRQLLSLREVEQACRVGGRRHAGIQTVAIDRIRGSEGRCNDFDCEFNPLETHTEHRWRSVARARREDKPLPPVELVLVGGIYFVRDGNHRVSVAHDLGQRSIEAEVTVWDVAGPLPWEQQEKAKLSDRPFFGAGAVPQAA